MIKLSCIAVVAAAIGVARAADITFDTILALPPTGPGVRSPFRADPVLLQIASGEFHAPKAGDEIGGKKWQEVKANDGGFDVPVNPRLAGGYAFASFTAEADSIMLLEAGGHGMVYFNGEPRVGDPYDNNMAKLPVKVHK